MSAFGGAQCLSLFFISYEPRTVNKTADVRIVFSQHSGELKNCSSTVKGSVMRDVRSTESFEHRRNFLVSSLCAISRACPDPKCTPTCSKAANMARALSMHAGKGYCIFNAVPPATIQALIILGLTPDGRWTMADSFWLPSVSL